jgi:hypothetical protein
VVNGKLTELQKKLGLSEIQVFKWQTWYQAEVRRSQTFQQGFEVQQQKCISMFQEHDQDMSIIRQDLELAEKLIVSQKEMIDHQQSASHPATVGPLLPNYNDQNQPYYEHYYQPRNQEFVVDPTLRQVGNYDYNIETSMESSCESPLVMSNPAPVFEQQTSNSYIPSIPSIQSILHPVSAERDVEVPANAVGGLKRIPQDEGAKPNKKRRMK